MTNYEIKYNPGDIVYYVETNNNYNSPVMTFDIKEIYIEFIEIRDVDNVVYSVADAVTGSRIVDGTGYKEEWELHASFHDANVIRLNKLDIISEFLHSMDISDEIYELCNRQVNDIERSYKKHTEINTFDVTAPDKDGNMVTKKYYCSDFSDMFWNKMEERFIHGIGKDDG